MSRFPGNIPPPIARSVRREAGNGPPKAQPARKRSGKRTAAPDGLWRAASQGAHRRGAVPASGTRSLRSQDRGAVGREARRLFFCGSVGVDLMPLRTPLYETHVAAGARMVDFGGWDMPVDYGSQIEEHHAVRRDAGMFDVSHMCVVDLRGDRVREFLRRLLANDVAKLTQPGKALYSCMLRETGGVIDDLIVYYMNDQWFRMVVNAGTRDKDLEWMRGIRRSVRCRRRAAHRSCDDRGAGTQRARRRPRACWTRTSPRVRSSSAPSSGWRRAPGSWRVPVTPARTAGRSCCRPPRRRRSGVASARCGHRAMRTRRTRYAASRGRHESLRQRHGRDDLATRIRARLDRRLGAAGSRLHRPRSARGATSGRCAAQARRACCSRAAACCARTRKSSCPRSARAKSPAAAFRRRSSARSVLRGCRCRPPTAAKSRSADGCSTRAVVRPPFVRNGKIAIPL